MMTRPSNISVKCAKARQRRARPVAEEAGEGQAGCAEQSTIGLEHCDRQREGAFQVLACRRDGAQLALDVAEEGQRENDVADPQPGVIVDPGQSARTATGSTRSTAPATARESLSSSRWSGARSAPTTTDAVQLMFKNTSRSAQRLVELVAWGQLRVLTGPTYPLERAADAHRALSERRTVGKVVLLPSA
jgi:hypothetical protein